MDYYRCENPDCGFLTGEEPDVCPRCGGTFFTPLLEEDLTGGDWVWLGNQAVDEKRDTDALACYQHAAALGDDSGLTNLGWCLEAGVGLPADPKQAVVLYAQAAARARRELTNCTGKVIHAVQRLHDNALNAQIVAPILLHQLGVVQTLNPDAGGARHPSRGVLHRDRTGTRNRALRFLRSHRGDNLDGLTLNQVARTQREVLHAALRILQTEEQGTADAFSLHDLAHPAVNILNQQAAAQRHLTRGRRLAAHAGGV